MKIDSGIYIQDGIVDVIFGGRIGLDSFDLGNMDGVACALFENKTLGNIGDKYFVDRKTLEELPHVNLIFDNPASIDIVIEGLKNAKEKLINKS